MTSTAEITYPHGMGQGGGGYQGGGGGQYQGGGNRGQQQNRGGGQNRPPQQQQRNQQPQQQQNKPVNQQQKPAGQLPHPLVIVDDIIALHVAVTAKLKEAYPEANEEAIDRKIATVFISADKQGCILDFRERAKKPIVKQYPPAPKDPAQWKEAFIPSGDAAGKKLSEVPKEYVKKLFDFFNERGDNTPFANCVYRAAEDLGLVNRTPAPDPDLDAAPDDIPF